MDIPLECSEVGAHGEANLWPEDVRVVRQAKDEHAGSVGRHGNHERQAHRHRAEVVEPDDYITYIYIYIYV